MRLTNGKFRKFSALVLAFVSSLSSELLEGDSWKRKTLNGEYGQAGRKIMKVREGWKLVVGGFLAGNRGKYVTPNQGSGSMGGF